MNNKKYIFIVFGGLTDDVRNVLWRSRRLLSPQPPLFDLYNSSDHTQPGPIIAKYLILLFQLVLYGD